MPAPSLAPLRSVADRLDRLGLGYAFVGGAIVNLLLDRPEFSPARPTDDLDVIVEAITSAGYAEVEAKLRELGFNHDVRPGAPRCRWIWAGLTVDIMPAGGTYLGLNIRGFAEALESASDRTFGHTRIRLVSPVAFLALKHAAFVDRSGGDFRASHDLEDMLTVIDGRENIVGEVAAAPAVLRAHVRDAIRRLLSAPSFNESLPGHLPSDAASQGRLGMLRRKLELIAAGASG